MNAQQEDLQRRPLLNALASTHVATYLLNREPQAKPCPPDIVLVSWYTNWEMTKALGNLRAFQVNSSHGLLVT